MVTTDPTARELLEAAFRETGEVSDDYAIRDADELERTPSGAELLRRADEPRMAEGLDPLHGDWCAKCVSWRQAFPVTTSSSGFDLPAPRPPEPPDLRVTKGPGTFGPDATWTIRTEPDRHKNHRMPGPHRLGAVKEHRSCGCCPCFKVPPPEPDRTAALVAAYNLVAADYHQTQVDAGWHSEALTWDECDGTLCRSHRQYRDAALAATPGPAPVANGTVCKCGCSVCPCSNPSEKDWRWCIDCESGNHVAGYRTPTPPTPEATDAAE